MEPADFPQDLRDAQRELHRTREAYEAFCRELPWSVEPAPGWSGDRTPYSEYRPDFPDSPGYSEEQKAEEARLRGRLLELSVAVSTHPYWSTLERGAVVEARMELKRVAREPPPREWRPAGSDGP
ncbi:hypothetical protein [Streptomyces sp. AK02-01A]|uniref:hypothetical protein n=1 Tax=Streptomyces sp. AK02-01A TaxID=3028648 RepID=UPI0029B3BB3B|nr:hypothetical protein [Streptomyces sp. AK02-01A]MDX3853207.1 hypothetical protein [Streptomyces sp. AK02-01A]